MPVPDFAHGLTKCTITAFTGQSVAAASNPVLASNSATAGQAPTFDDLIDTVNPLQHFPVVGTLYRAISGDKISDLAQVAGDTLYGGPLGLISSLADLTFKKTTGKDIGDTVLSMVTGDDIGGDATQVAANTPKPATSTASATPPQTIAQAQTPAQQAAARTQLPQIATTVPASLVFPATSLAVQSASPTQDSNLAALQAAIRQDGINADLGMRATLAYQQSMTAGGGAMPALPAN
jgi:hypothetical protein